jgi:hypothetical protein
MNLGTTMKRASAMRGGRFLAAALLGAASVFAGGGSADAGETLVVKRFLLGRLESGTNKFVATGGPGTTNAFRNNVIMLVFSGAVDYESLDNRTVKIGIPKGSLFVGADGDFYQYAISALDEVSGQFVEKRKYKNRIIFDPTKIQSPAQQQNPYGFEAGSTYSVIIPGLDSGTSKTVRGRKGAYLGRTFTTSFNTTDKFLQDFRPPSITKIEGSDAPGVPLQNRVNVDSRADIIAYFSEPMLPTAFDVNTTFTVFNEGQNRLVSGSIRPSPDGTFFTFRPALGYGRGPYLITVSLSTQLTDRSGNQLDRGQVLTFTSESDPLAPSYDEEVETFESNSQEDTVYTPVDQRALWNGSKTPGQLIGVFGSQPIEIQFSNSGGHGIPWWTAQAHTQWIYNNSNVGNVPRTISGFTWRYYSVTVCQAATYSSTSVMLGHNTTSATNTNFTGTFSDTPVTVVNLNNYTPDTTVVEWIPGPTFTTNWAYNGKDNVVLDINVPNGGARLNYWRLFTGGPANISLRAYSGGAPQQVPYQHDIRFHYLTDKSDAQSRWYDSGTLNPTYSDPLVIQTVPPGTTALIQYQGAHENPFLPGTADPSTGSAWTTDPAANLAGFRFFRFRTFFTANVSTQQRPIIDEIKLPFIYY